MASLREEILEDCLDFVGRRVVFSDGLSRLQYFQKFEELYFQESSLSTVTYGRLYNLSEITEFLVILTQGARPKDEEPYTVDAPPGNNLIPRTEPFEKWKASDWKSLRENLVKIQTSMLRRDANASIDEILSKEGENKEIDPSRSYDPWFTEKLFKVLDLFKLHEKLAPFREELEIRSSVVNGASKPLTLPQDLWIEFLDMVDEEEEKRIKKAFLSLMKKDEDSFHSRATIRRLLDDSSQPHSFAFFLHRVNKLMRAWASQVLTNDATIGVNLETDKSNKPEQSEKTDSGQTRALKRLQRHRARLNETVEDPLAEAVIVAAKAKRPRKRKQREPSPSEGMFKSNDEIDENVSDGDQGISTKPKSDETKSPKTPKGRGSMLEKKKSATRLEFSPEKESDSEEIEDPMEDGDVLPEVRKRAPKIASPSPSKKLKSQQKMYEGRKIWTDAEKQAVIEGIKEFGVGHWAKTKARYHQTLKFRTSGQIKDCYRTMKKRGELEFLDEQTPGKEVSSKDDTAEEEKKNSEEEEEQEQEENSAEEAKEEEEEEAKEEVQA